MKRMRPIESIQRYAGIQPTLCGSKWTARTRTQWLGTFCDRDSAVGAWKTYMIMYWMTNEGRARIQAARARWGLVVGD